MRRVIVAPDKFKGSLTAIQVAAHLEVGLRTGQPDLEIAQLPLADGGEGTVDAAVSAGFHRVSARVSGPTGQLVDACLAVRGDTAVVELAEASGLSRLPGGRPAPLTASSRGTGELLRVALDAGCRQVVLAIGGSACTDGGAGMLQALGMRLLDRAERELAPGAVPLLDLDHVDLSGLDPRLSQTAVTLASDVDNPLLGPSGAATIYGPQKGAGPADIPRLEAALTRWASILCREIGPHDPADQPGAGAAGGVGFAALAILAAHRRPGVDVLLELVGFDAAVREADLVVTGEGSLDDQSLYGKAPVGVAAAARVHGVSTVAVAGRCSLTAAQLFAAGFDRAYPLTDIEPDLGRCMSQAGSLVEQVGGRIAADRQRGKA